jgi:Tol biopolymer transport system component
VDHTGRLEAVSPGRASIVASAAWGRPDTLEVIVTGNLLLTSDRRLRGTPGIYQINLARPDSLIPLMTDTRRLLSPALSPDRRRIAYSATADGRNYDLWVADADGRNPRALTNDSIPETEPSWSPDGTKIVFTTSTRREREQFGVINADGTGRRMLTVPPGTSQNPVFSPDGRYIAFLGLRNRDVDVFVMDQNATGAAALRNVTSNEDKERQVRYAANGDLIVLVEMERNRGYQIVKYAAGTNTRSVLATSAYEVTSFGISRDGSTLAYVTTEPVENVRGQRTKTVLYLQPTAAGSTATAVRTPVAETVGFPSF